MISKSDVGSWVIKGNPGVWDYFAARAGNSSALNSRHLLEDSWTIGSNYRKDLVQSSDLMVLWITGPRKPGIYEIGRLLSEPYPAQGFDDEYAVDMEKARRPNHVVDYEAVRLDTPVTRAELKADPVLRSCEQFRAPQGANPSYFTPEEVEALKMLLLERARKADLRAAGWS